VQYAESSVLGDLEKHEEWRKNSIRNIESAFEVHKKYYSYFDEYYKTGKSKK
jgi:hypothetical protein